MEFKHTQLSNGLTIIAEANPAAATIAAGFFVRTGSRDETGDISGVTHFLEHMAFKGTDRRSVFDVNREFDEMGAHYNASTSEENTIFYASTLPEFQTRLLDLLCDILRPALRQEDFDVEKNIILDEIAMSEDQPKFQVYHKLMSAYFGAHPLGNPILGTQESIRALRREQMQEYFERRYSPLNVTVVGVGKLDWNAFVDKVERMCSHWRPSPAVRQTPRADPSRGEKIIADPKLARQQIGLMSPAPSCQDPRRYAAQLLATIVGDSTGSRLFYALVDPAIADEADMAYFPMDGEGAFLTFLSADADRAGEALRITRAELRKFLDGGFRDAELLAAKNKIASGATVKGELPMGRLAAVGFDWVYRHEYVPLAEQIDTLFAVTGDQVMDVARACDLTAPAVLALGPRETL